MAQTAQLAIGAVIGLGAAAQWLAWRLRVPSILFLLLFGFLAGPVLGWIKPHLLFGDLLLPLVSIAVALILFEGGLSLNFHEIRSTAGVIALLVSVGAGITWLLAGLAAYFLLGLEPKLAALLGAILTVTGPTVVLPLIRDIRPKGAVAALLKWEGIVIDPIGALLAVLVFETVRQGASLAGNSMLSAVLKTVAGGCGIGLLAALILVFAIRRFWVPDYLQATFTLMLVVVAFVSSNLVQAESGLLAVTVMGVALANQPFADTRQVLEFKENLRVFLLSAVFILLSAGIRLDDLRLIGPGVIAFVVLLIVVVRPACVAVSTIGSGLGWRQRAFLACIAPRGIVAAAVTAVFALELRQSGHPQAGLLVPIVFATIIATVLFYGLCGAHFARWLKLSDSNPQGLLLVGANHFARQIAAALQPRGLRVLMVDTNAGEIAWAESRGLTAFHGSILSEDVRERLDLTGIGRLLALTPNDELNLLACDQFARLFGRASVFRLPPRQGQDPKATPHRHMAGRELFSPSADFWRIESLGNAGARIVAIRPTSTAPAAPPASGPDDAFLPLFVTMEPGPSLQVVTAGERPTPRAGQTLFVLSARPDADAPHAEAHAVAEGAGGGD